MYRYLLYYNSYVRSSFLLIRCHRHWFIVTIERLIVVSTHIFIREIETEKSNIHEVYPNFHTCVCPTIYRHGYQYIYIFFRFIGLRFLYTSIFKYIFYGIIIMLLFALINKYHK